MIQSTKHLVSRRKQKNTNIISRYFQLHRDPDIELKSLGLVLKYQSNLRKLLKKNRGKGNFAKINGRQRKSKSSVASDSIFWCSLTGGLSQIFSYALTAKMLVAKSLQKRDCWKPYLDYENNVCKYESSRCRVNFLINCLSTDIIPDFLKFRVPKTNVFLDKAVHSFQQKLLRSETSTAADTHRKCDQKRAASRKVLHKNLDNHLLPSVIFV